MRNLAGANTAFAALAGFLGLGTLLRFGSYILIAYRYLRSVFSLVNRIPFLVKWAEKLKNMGFKQLAWLAWKIIFWILAALMTFLNWLIRTFESLERLLSQWLDWDHCIMKWLRGVRYTLEDLRRWLDRLSRQLDDAWRDQAPYGPGYHP
ncbi:MAG: hypothetical protein V1792_04835 [Pseudomonadota bacterium]